eukprot:1154067-Pelagomonas_calceolata.AAC.10
MQTRLQNSKKSCSVRETHFLCFHKKRRKFESSITLKDGPGGHDKCVGGGGWCGRHRLQVTGKKKASSQNKNRHQPPGVAGEVGMAGTIYNDCTIKPLINLGLNLQALVVRRGHGSLIHCVSFFGGVREGASHVKQVAGLCNQKMPDGQHKSLRSSASIPELTLFLNC